MLYQIDQTGSGPPDVFREFWVGQVPTEQLRRFAENLVLGVFERRDELDRLISRAAEHWRLERMAVVDRNVLRIAAYELMYETDVPPVVVIDEAIEVAKKFGAQDSGGFINGVLDSIRGHIGERQREDDSR